jgi:glycosyltransferase involved in cell wall biosynthesis
VPRIAMVIQRYYPHIGGAEKQLQQLAPRLQARGFDVFIITRLEKGLDRFEVVDGVEIHRIFAPGPKFFASAFFTLGAVIKLTRLRPDIVHAHEILSPTTVAILAKRFSGSPVVVKLLRGGIRGDIYKLKRRPLGLKHLSVKCKNVDAFVVISREIDRELEDCNVLPEKRVFVPNGVDTEHFVPLSAIQRRTLRAELSIPLICLAVVYLGRLMPEKRVDQILQIWPEIQQMFPDAKLLIIGAGADEPRLRGMSGPGVQFIGQVEDAARFLQASDLFILPSSTEGLSNSLLEAMSTGLPVLATSVGGTPDVIRHEVDGYLVPPDDQQALMQGVLRLLGDEKLRARLGKNGHHRILSNYSLDSVADRLGNLYMKLLRD